MAPAKNPYATDTRSKEVEIDPALHVPKLQAIIEEIALGRIEVIVLAESSVRGTETLILSYRKAPK